MTPVRGDGRGLGGVDPEGLVGPPLRKGRRLGGSGQGGREGDVTSPVGRPWRTGRRGAAPAPGPPPWAGTDAFGRGESTPDLAPSLAVSSLTLPPAGAPVGRPPPSPRRAVPPLTLPTVVALLVLLSHSAPPGSHP